MSGQSTVFTCTPAAAAAGVQVMDEVVYLPVQCRGLHLLGFLFDGCVLVCVHQLAVELWKRYDTPRVSVQKKILEMGLNVVNCSREQVRVLRKAGVIGNFRATMLTLPEAELLFDALEFSRKKRGLVKHALKSTPLTRELRTEEKRAKTMSHKIVTNGLQYSDSSLALPALPLGILVTTPDPTQGALIREGTGLNLKPSVYADEQEKQDLLFSCVSAGDSSLAPFEFVAPLIAEDASESPVHVGQCSDYEVLIERVCNEAMFSASGAHANVAASQHLEHSYAARDHQFTTQTLPKGGSDPTGIAGKSLNSVLNGTAVLPSSQTADPSSQPKKQLTRYSDRTANGCAAPASSKVPPSGEDFIYIDSDSSDLEPEVSANSNQNNKHHHLVPHRRLDLSYTATHSTPPRCSQGSSSGAGQWQQSRLIT